MSYNGYCRVEMSYTGYCRVEMSYTGSCRVEMFYTGYCRVEIYYTGYCRVEMLHSYKPGAWVLYALVSDQSTVNIFINTGIIRFTCVLPSV
jgi:hypothetical protein